VVLVTTRSVLPPPLKEAAATEEPIRSARRGELGGKAAASVAEQDRDPVRRRDREILLTVTVQVGRGERGGTLADLGRRPAAMWNRPEPSLSRTRRLSW
jgi:hypothetical protein